MKPAGKLLGLALPVATVLTLLALLAAGGVRQVGALPDLLAYALELAPRTMYAIAIGGSTALSMHFTGMDIANTRRCDLLDKAAGGEIGAMVVLAGETLGWFGWAVLWSFVYLHS